MERKVNRFGYLFFGRLASAGVGVLFLNLDLSLCLDLGQGDFEVVLGNLVDLALIAGGNLNFDVPILVHVELIPGVTPAVYLVLGSLQGSGVSLLLILEQLNLYAVGSLAVPQDLSGYGIVRRLGLNYDLVVVVIGGFGG